MKITHAKEFEGSIWFSFKAETLEEAALITRAGMNGTQKIELMADAYQDGDFSLSFRVSKTRHSSSRIKSRTSRK